MQTYERQTITPATDGQRERASRRTTSSAQGAATYYNRPMIKKPTWKWFIPLYFALGGLAGGAAAIGAAAELLGGPRHRTTVRHARYLGIALAPLCASLLIADLGRPTRFHHMLRVFKGSSPLNVGTWILTAFGLTSGVLAARQAAEDDVIIRRQSTLGRLARLLPSGPFTVAHGLLGLALGGYTGVLLAVTAVPLWAAAGVLLGPLFLATGITSGAATLIVLGVLSGRQTRAARRDLQDVANLATFAQLGVAVAREVLVPRRVNRPLSRGMWGRLFQFGAVGGGLGAPMLLRGLAWIARPGLEPILSAGAACCALAGTLIERFAIVEGGKQSAEDPLAYQEMTRGSPGEARPTPTQQAMHAPSAAREQPFRPGQVVPLES